MHEYKIELMEEVSLANRRGRREGDKPGRERIDEMKGLLTSEERIEEVKDCLTCEEGGVGQTGR